MNSPGDLPLILAIESSAGVASVALYEGSRILAAFDLHLSKSHASALAPLAEAVLERAGKAPNDLSAVAVARGPGSYTGLRVGVSLAKGLCFALDIPLMSLGTLEGLAAQAAVWAKQMRARICPMLDARRSEVYAALYSPDLESLAPPMPLLVTDEVFSEWLEAGPVIFLGDGAAKCPPTWRDHPHARVLTGVECSARGWGERLNQDFWGRKFEDLASFEPQYLKSPRITAARPKKGSGVIVPDSSSLPG